MLLCLLCTFSVFKLCNSEVQIVAGQAVFTANPVDGVGTNARFMSVVGLTYNQKYHSLYVSDGWYTGGVIRKVEINKNYIVTTIAGNNGYLVDPHVDGQGTNAHFSANLGLVADADGVIYVSDEGFIRKINTTGYVSTLIYLSEFCSSCSALQFGSGIALSKSNDLIFSSYTYDVSPLIVIASFVFNTTLGQGFVNQVISTTVNLDFNPHYASPLNPYYNGYAWFSTDYQDELYGSVRGTMIDNIEKSSGYIQNMPYTGSIPGYLDGCLSAALFYNSSGADIDQSGNIFVSDTGNQVIRKVDKSSGQVTTVAGEPGISGTSGGTPGHFYNPGPLAVLPDGSVVYVGTGSNVIQAVQLPTSPSTATPSVSSSTAPIPVSPASQTPTSSRPPTYTPSDIGGTVSGTGSPNSTVVVTIVIPILVTAISLVLFLSLYIMYRRGIYPFQKSDETEIVLGTKKLREWIKNDGGGEVKLFRPSLNSRYTDIELESAFPRNSVNSAYEATITDSDYPLTQSGIGRVSIATSSNSLYVV